MSCAVAAQASTAVQDLRQPAPLADWVVMTYLVGDNNISAMQGQVLENIRQVGSSSQVGIAVLIDQILVDDTRLLYLNGTTYVQQAWPSESSMDDPATLVQFVSTVQAAMPANHYALFISSNKGCGWQGVCWDEHGRGQMITMPELQEALNQITNGGYDKLDVLGIETCMTGNLEVAYQIRTYVDYFIAYPECSMALDWPYVLSFTDLKATPTMTPEAFSIMMVNHFVPRDLPAYLMKTTMSATNLTHMRTLGTSMRNLQEYFLNNLELYRPQIAAAIEDARVYALSWNIDYYIDLYDFLDQCAIDDPEFVQIRDGIEYTMDEAVIANNHLPTDPVHGLSIYLPRRAGDYNDSLRYEVLPSPYEDTSFAMVTGWDTFLRAFLGIENNAAPSAPVVTGPARVKVGTPSDFVLVSTDPEAQEVYYFIDWGDGTTDDWLGPYISGEEVTVNHTWTERSTYTVQVKAKDAMGAESSWATLTVKAPFVPGRSLIVLIGTVASVEKDPAGNFRFLPASVLEVSHIVGEERTVRVLEDVTGEYPCCAYIPSSQFHGLLTKNVIAGVWLLPS